jgi:hypothetical protein
MKKALIMLLVAIASLTSAPGRTQACGWALLSAPIRAAAGVHATVKDKYDITAPLSQWIHMKSYDNAKECEKDKDEKFEWFLKNTPEIHVGTEADRVGQLWVGTRMYRCLPFDALQTLPK